MNPCSRPEWTLIHVPVQDEIISKIYVCVRTMDPHLPSSTTRGLCHSIDISLF